MFCPSCGKEMTEDTAFCIHCGAPVQAAPRQPMFQQPFFQNGQPALNADAAKGFMESMKNRMGIGDPELNQGDAFEKDKLIVPEIYLRLISATVYNNIDKKEDAVRHLDKAIALAMPDRLYGLLAVYYRSVSYLMEQRLALVSEEALATVKELQKALGANYAKLSNTVKSRNMAANLTAREREVAKLAVFGFSNQEIADKLGISVAGVKQTLRSATHKGNVQGRQELASIL